MSTTDPQSYDLFPYLSHCYSETHPDNLAVAALQRGLRPTPVAKCRVLELGCASGGNLMPMAAMWPESQFVGIDRSTRQVEEGQRLCSTLGLRNIELRAIDFMDFDGGSEPFDYILCHGVFSWVPEPVQQRVLQLCQRHLAAQGIAYISYNTYPGFYRRQPIMEMMRYHVAGAATTDPTAQVREARALLQFLIKGQSDVEGTTARLLREEAQLIERLPDSYVFHEHFEADNRPCYFHQFMKQADEHGLQYVGEAAARGGLAGLPEGTQQILAQLASEPIKQEQYIDFVRNTAMRSTLLCRKENVLSTGQTSAFVNSLWVSSTSRPSIPSELQGEKLRTQSPATFQTLRGSAVIEHPHVKAMLFILHQHQPASLTIPDLAAATSALLGESLDVDTIAGMALYSHNTGLCRLHTVLPAIARSISEFPSASPLARITVANAGVAPNQWHESVRLPPFEQTLLPFLDGTRDHEALLDAMQQAVLDGTLVVNGPDGSQLRNASLARKIVAQHLPKALQTLLDSALLVS